MKPIQTVAVCVAILLGLSAFAYQSANSAVAEKKAAAAECLNCAECGDEETVCPAGPDCFAPDVCPDTDMVCPADEPAAAKAASEACTSECCASEASDA